MPGMLKNTIDWVSRMSPQPFNELNGLLLSASPSMVGGNRGLWALRVPFEHLGARVYPDMFSLAQAHSAFDSEGRLVSPQLGRALQHEHRQLHGLRRGAQALPVHQESVGRVPRRAPRAGHRSGAVSDAARAASSCERSSSTRSACASASALGGNARLGIAITARPAACAEAIPADESSTATQRSRGRAEPARRLQVDVGRGLAARHFLGGDRLRKQLAPAAAVEHELDYLAVGRGREAQRPARRQRAHGGVGARDQRKLATHSAPPRARRPAPRSPPGAGARRARRACSGSTRASSCRACASAPRR